MNPRQTNNKSTVPRFRAFFLARRRESTNLINPVIRSMMTLLGKLPLE